MYANHKARQDEHEYPAKPPKRPVIRIGRFAYLLLLFPLVALGDLLPYDFEQLRSDVATGADTRIHRVYTEAKALADASVGLPPADCSYPGGSGDYATYECALTDSERMVSLAIAYQGTLDLTYANEAHSLLMYYRQESPGVPQRFTAWEIAWLLAYDMIRDSGVFSAQDLADITSSLTSWGGDNIASGFSNPTMENMTMWHGGIGAVQALLVNDAALIAQAEAWYTGRFLGSIGSQGDLPDWTGRAPDGVDYHEYSLTPVMFMAIAGAQAGYDWHTQTNSSGLTIVDAARFLADASSIQPDANCGVTTVFGGIPYSGSCPTSGDYGDTLPVGRLTDKRHVLRLALTFGYDATMASAFNCDLWARWQATGQPVPATCPGPGFNYLGAPFVADLVRVADIGGPPLPPPPPPPPPPDPQCSDGIDNDGDGETDYPADDGCTDAQDDDETDPPPPGGTVVDRTIVSPTSPETACTDSGVLNLTGQSLTITATITPNAPLTNDNRVIIQGETWNSADIYLYLAVDGSETKLRVKIAGLTRELSVPRGVSSGETVTIVATYDGAQLRLDAAGTVGTLAASGDITPGGSTLCEVGTQPNDTQYPVAPFPGDISVQVEN